MSCGGKHLHIATLIMRKYTRGLSTSTRPDLLVPAAETILTDGRTDVKKKVRFLEKKSFWFGRVQAGRIFPYFGRIFPYFRTPSGRPSAKKGTFEEKRHLHVCVAWADLPRTSCHQNWAIHPRVRNWVLRPTLETYPHACNNERAKRVQNPKQARSKPWHQTRKREPIVWKSLLLHLQAAKTKMAPATMSCKLAMWHMYLISTVSAVPPWVNITNMQKTILDFKKSTFGKKCHFSWKTPKIKGRWRVKVQVNICIQI